jgi:hypothetical protein
LLLDAGLLVELKRYVAKEATDNGQIIDDSNLTDFRIFERLERGVPFRSFATKLVQKYGYLLPSVNPNSDYGKQQEFVLKERARRLVQIEAQEDATAAAQSQRQFALSEIENCDESQQECGKSTTQKTKRSQPFRLSAGLSGTVLSVLFSGRRNSLEESAQLHARLLCAALPVRRESF